MIKKVHELAVICGLKVSVICTDFEKSCFTYCNDSRLEHDLESVFSTVHTPVWLTNFKEREVN